MCACSAVSAILKYPMKAYLARITSTLGDLLSVSTDDRLFLLLFADMPMVEKRISSISASLNITTLVESESKISTQLQIELDEYFVGKRKVFSVPIQLTGTSFQLETLSFLYQSVKCGERITYSDLSVRLHKEASSRRATARALSRNPILIIVPCHRIIPSTPNSLGGFAAGVHRKAHLLLLENNKES